MKKTTSIPAQAKKIFTTTYGRIVGVSLISTLANIAVVVAMEVLIDLNYSASDTIAYFADAPLSFTFFAPLIGIGTLTTLLILLIAIITATSISTILINNKSFTEAVGFGITKGLRSIPVQLLFTLLLLAGSIPSMLTIFLGSLIASEGLSVLFIILGASLLLLPTILLIRGMFITFIWVEQQKERARAIIKKSFALTKGAVGWKIVLSVIILAIGVGIIHPLILAVLSTLGTPLSAEDLSSFTDDLVTIFLFMPALYALLYALYQHAKKRGKSTKKKNA